MQERLSDNCIELINHGAKVNYPDKMGITPLMYSTLWVNIDCIRLLIKSGADVNACDAYGVTALMFAARGGFIRAADMLIDNGANINAADNSGKIVLMYARDSELLHNIILYRLIAEGADDSYYEPFKNEMKIILDRIRDNEKFKPSETNWIEETAKWREKTNTEEMHKNYENTLKSILYLQSLHKYGNFDNTGLQQLNKSFAGFKKLQEQISGLLGGNIEPTDEVLEILRPDFEFASKMAKGLRKI